MNRSCTTFNPIIIQLSSIWEPDLPDVIGFRRYFYTESERIQFISRSFLDPKWMDEIRPLSENPLLIAEGLFMYFNEQDLKDFFTHVVRRFPGAVILCEVFHTFITRRQVRVPSRSEKPRVQYKWEFPTYQKWRLYIHNCVCWMNGGFSIAVENGRVCIRK